MCIKLLFVLGVFFAGIGCSSENLDNKIKDENITKRQSHPILPAKFSTLKNVSVYDSNSVPFLDISFTKKTTFGESEERLYQGVGQFAVDDIGKVFIVNGRGIEVFNPKGNHIGTLGRSGRGPGEFSNITRLSPIIKSGKLYAYDDVLRRINVFHTDSLVLSRTIKVNPKIWSDIPNLRGAELDNYFIFNVDQTLFEFRDTAYQNSDGPYYKRYYLIEHKKETISHEVFKYKFDKEKSPFIILPNRKTDWPFPNASGRYMQIHIAQNNYIYTTRTEDFFIKVHSPEGKYLRSIYYPYINTPLVKDEIINSYSKKVFIQRAKDHEYPNTWPAIDQIFTDDENRIWVSTIIDDEKNYEWWVLENSGELISKFKWPGERLKRAGLFRVQPVVKNGYFYTRETDTKTGMRQVVKYKINLKNRNEELDK